MRAPILIFLAVAFLGCAATTLGYRYFQSSPKAPAVLKDRSPVNLSVADTKLIEARESTSRWLLGLAFALLPGLVVKPNRGQMAGVPPRLLPQAAAGMLVTSVYGFFLAQDSIVFVLSRGPQYHLYGWVSDFPLWVQFWALLVALMLLLAHWLRPSVLALAGSAIFVLSLTPDHVAIASPLSRAEVSQCITAWTTSRGFRLNEQQQALSSKVVWGVAQRADLQVPGCDFVGVQLDNVRWMAFQKGDQDSVIAFDGVLRVIDNDLTRTGFAPGEELEQLIRVTSIWRAPSGLLRISASGKAFKVVLDGRLVGVTELDIRLAPGLYRVELLNAGRLFFSAPCQVRDGETSSISPPR